jgi:non-canonical purine NTP pyrophosphatase (RdgB/HAM1 family)
MNGKTMRTVVLASRNEDKVREMRELMDGLPFEVKSAADYPGLPDVIEDGTTILGNSSRKAIITAAYTGEIAVADDTALVVHELNGLPDIFAARFSGPQATYNSNARLLVEMLEGVADGARQARFETSCVWVDPRPQSLELDVLPPARRRFLRNPYAGSVMVPGEGESEWDMWDGVMDRKQVWADYRRMLGADLVSQGHDRQKLQEIIEGLLAACEDDSEKGIRLPDTRIWGLKDAEALDGPLTDRSPSGMPADAPGKELNHPVWVEISTTGRLLGEITRQPVGGMGFGYDPVFRPVGLDVTLAEMDSVQKNAISHRGRGMQRLMGAVGLVYG